MSKRIKSVGGKKKELPDHKAPRRGRRRRKLHLSLETDATGVSVPKEGRWGAKQIRTESSFFYPHRTC